MQVDCVFPRLISLPEMPCPYVGVWLPGTGISIKSPQSLALSRAYSFYSEGLYPFSDRIINVMQVLLGYYTPHLCTHTMVDADLLWPLLRVPLTHPHTWLHCPWPISATQCTNQSCKPPENKRCISAYCPEMRSPSSQWILLTWTALLLHTALLPPQAGCLLPPRCDKTHLLPYTAHLTPHHCNTCSAFTFLLTSKFTVRKTTTPKPHRLQLELSSN